MPRNFNLPSGLKGNLKIGSLPLSAFKDPQLLIRIGLGVLLVANLVAAAFAFHLFDDSPDKIASQVRDARKQVVLQIRRLGQTRLHASKVDKGRDDGAKFISTYMTNRRVTYSTIISEINLLAVDSAMTPKDAIMHLDAIDGTENLDVLTITANFEGEYRNLLAFINKIDKSNRFLIIESLGATPQTSGRLQVTMKFYTFVQEDANPL